MSKRLISAVGKCFHHYTEEFRRDAIAMIESEGLMSKERPITHEMTREDDFINVDHQVQRSLVIGL